MKRRHNVAPIHLLYQTCLRIGGNVHQIRHHSESNKTQNQMKNRSTATDAEKNQGIEHLRENQHLLAAKSTHQDTRESHHQKLADRNGEKHRSQLAVAQMQHLFYIRNTACPTGKHYSRHKIISRNRHSLARQIT